MAWDRKEAAALLMAGAGVISGIEAALFSKWVDARLELAKAARETSAPIESVVSLVTTVGLASITVLSVVWLICRWLLARSLPKEDRLDGRVSAAVCAVYVAIAIGWWAA